MTDDLSKLSAVAASATSLLKQSWFIQLLLWSLHVLCALSLFADVGFASVRSFVVRDLQFGATDGFLRWTEQIALPILQRPDVRTAVQLALGLLIAAAASGYFKDGQRRKPIIERRGEEGEDYAALLAGMPIMLRTAVAFLLATTVPAAQQWITLGAVLAIYWVALVAGEWRRNSLSFSDVVQFAFVVALGACVSVFYVPLTPTLVLCNLMSGSGELHAEGTRA